MTLIAEVKERENIAEYILYMWQMEDLVRGSNLDLEMIMDSLFSQRQPDKTTMAEYRKWFSGIIREMKTEGLEKKGHLKKVRDYIEAMDELHKALLIAFQDKRYIERYNKAAADLSALRERAGSANMTDIEVCLTGLYGFLVLKMRKTNISEETSLAMKNLGQMMAMLSAAFKRLQQGDLRLPHQMNN